MIQSSIVTSTHPHVNQDKRENMNKISSAQYNLPQQLINDEQNKKGGKKGT
jgi:hypothetical protein